MRKISGLWYAVKPLRQKIKGKGLFHIIGGSTLVKCIMLCSAILVPRFLEKTDYSLFVYVDNIISIIMLANGLGLANSILRYVSMSEDDGQRRAYFRFCVKNGMLFNGLAAVCMAAAFLWIPFDAPEKRQYILMMTLIPSFAFVFESLQLMLRGLLRNQYFTILNVSFSLLSVLFQILGARFVGVSGVIGARYIAYTGGIMLGFLLLFRTRLFKTPVKILRSSEKSELLKYALVVLSGNFASLLMPRAATFIVGHCSSDPALLANYNIAMTGPQNLEFVATSIMVFAYPYFARHSFDGRWIRKYYAVLSAGMAVLMAALVLILIPVTPALLNLLYAGKYGDAAPVMRLFWISYGIGTLLRTVPGNVLAAIGRVRFNLVINVCSVLLTIGLDFCFFRLFGLPGMVLGMFCVYLFAGIANLIYLLVTCMRLEREKVKGT